MNVLHLIILLYAVAGLTTSAVLRSGSSPSQEQTAIRSIRSRELSPDTQETVQARVVYRSRRDYDIHIDNPYYYNPCFLGIDEETNEEIIRCSDGTTERKFRQSASGW